MLASRSLRGTWSKCVQKSPCNEAALKLGPTRSPVARVRLTTSSMRSLTSSSHLSNKYQATPRPAEDRFHVTQETDDFEEDLDILEDYEEEEVPSSQRVVAGELPVRKFLQTSKNGPLWEYKGTETDTGRKVYRRQGVDPNAQVRRRERLLSAGSKRSSRKFETIILESPLTDKDMDSMDPALDAPPAPAFDFSKLSTQSSDLDALFSAVSTATGIAVSPQHRNALIQAFESSIKNQHQLKAMEASCYVIGHELLELHVINALSSTYPYLPHDGLVKLTQAAGTNEALSRALLALNLEPFIQIVPSTPLSKFEDPSTVCLDLAANAYTSLIGWVYLEKGFDVASQFLFQTLPMQRVTVDSLKRLKLVDGIQNSKVELHKLLERLRFPLPSYQIESATDTKNVSKMGYGNRFFAIVKSGHQIVGRGQANSKVRAEARAAANALLLHWAKEADL